MPRKKHEKKTVRLALSKEDVEKATAMTEIAEQLRSGIIEFVNNWLWAREMVVIENDAEKEPVTTYGATMDGAGNVRFVFYFKKKEPGIDTVHADQLKSTTTTSDW